MLTLGRGTFHGSLPTNVIKLPADNSSVDVVTLASGPDPSGPMTLAAPALLSLSVTLGLFNTDAGGVHTFTCPVELRPQGAGATTVSTLVETVAAFASQTVTATALVPVSAGTYDVGVRCSVVFLTTAGWLTSADLSVVALAR